VDSSVIQLSLHCHSYITAANPRLNGSNLHQTCNVHPCVSCLLHVNCEWLCRQSGRTAYRLQAKPVTTDFDLQPNSHTQHCRGLPFKGLHPCNPHGLLSFTDPGWLEGWVGLVGWPMVDTTNKVVTCQPQMRCRSGKVRQPKTDILATEPRRQLTLTY